MATADTSGLRPRLFAPSARNTNWLLIAGFLALGYALYLRYLVIEQPAVALACEAGLRTWGCTARALATALYDHSVFGAVALAAAVFNLARPSVVPFAVVLVAGGLGIVLYNVDLSALAIALLLISLARRAPETA
jgi:hypothetical protein